MPSLTFNKSLLSRLGLPDTQANELFLNIWEQAEGSKASNNPLATTMAMPGATDFNSSGVKNYPSETVGLDATAATLKLPQYAPIISAMRASDIKAAAHAVVNSPWGTQPHPLLDLAGDTSGNAVGEGVIGSTGDVLLGAGESAAKTIPSFGIGDLIRSVGNLTSHLLDSKWWLRIGQGVTAGILLLIALGLIFRKQIVRGVAAAATDGLSEA